MKKITLNLNTLMNQLDDEGDFPRDITFGMQYFSGSDFSKYSKKKIPTFARILRNSVMSWGEGFGELHLIPRGGREGRKHQHLLTWSQFSGTAQLDLA